jgi:AcrR family transcriptional regulator
LRSTARRDASSRTATRRRQLIFAKNPVTTEKRVESFGRGTDSSLHEKITKNKAARRPPLHAPSALPEKLKHRLYPAVLELFADNDFHRVNIREIYRKSGISPSTIYRYFPSKEDLLFAILDEKIGEIGVLVREHIRASRAPGKSFAKSSGLRWTITTATPASPLPPL